MVRDPFKTVQRRVERGVLAGSLPRLSGPRVKCAVAAACDKQQGQRRCRHQSRRRANAIRLTFDEINSLIGKIVMHRASLDRREPPIKEIANR